jgi:uncharacterized membrane protein YidH (DUF202 family)
LSPSHPTSVFAGIFIFGLDMIVSRRADIATRYSDDINPSFHVFRGLGAIAWGLVFGIVGVVFVGYATISLTNWTSAQTFLREHASILLVLLGMAITASGVGSATRATYRYRQAETPSRRLADRIAAIVFIIPIGLVIFAWGLLQTLVPSLAQRIASSAKAVAVEWLESMLK